MNIQTKLQEATNRQWHFWHTGGGMTALMTEFDDETYIMVTDDDCNAPEDENAEMIVGLYTADNIEGDCTYVANFTSALELVNKMIALVQSGVTA